MANCSFGPTGLPFQTSQPFEDDTRLGMIQLGCLMRPSAGSRVISPTPCPQVGSPSPPEPAPLCCSVRAQGPLSQVLPQGEASSPAPRPSVPAPLCCPGEAQGLFSLPPNLGGCFPKHHRWRGLRGRALSLHPQLYCAAQARDGANLPALPALLLSLHRNFLVSTLMPLY